MANGYSGKILDIDLSAGKFSIEEPGEKFYRTYLGGPGFGLYYLLRYLPPDTDALSAENVLVFAPGLLTGTNAPCMSRFTVCAKSPLTGALGKSEAGGWWGPELKMAGLDAIVVRGKAAKPVYIWVNDGSIEIRSAEHLWGLETGLAADRIKKELNDNKVRIAQIGPAGENLVRYAGIGNELAHYNGRNGLGAVMGSKNLKAIAVRGTKAITAADPEKLTEITRWIGKEAQENALAKMLKLQGTNAGLTSINAAGALPWNNWQTGIREEAQAISGEKLSNEIMFKRGTCFACPIQCKRVVKLEGDIEVDPAYGGPEYETVAALGSNCGVADLRVIAKAHEICNRHGMDVISAGAAISFAMECFEKNLLSEQDTGGLDLKFGDGDVILKLLDMIARREGFGSLLADGAASLAAKIGKGSEKLLVQVKGQDAPMHDPRLKTGVALQYALSPMGADHWFAQHDPFFVPGNPIGKAAGAPLGLLEGVEATDLSWSKIRMVLYTSMLNLVYDGVGACVFGFAPRSVTPINKLVEMTEAVTGWGTSLWELMKTGERISNMAREFNCRQGFGPDDDSLPERFTVPMGSGPHKGSLALDKKQFREAVGLFYDMAGWDDGGRPTEGKLLELGLYWLVNEHSK